MRRKRQKVPNKRRETLRHYFVPGAHNSHRPHFLRAKAVATTAALITLSFFVALGAVNLVVRSPSPSVAAVVASVLVELTNEDREAQGQHTLRVNETLTHAAQMKADDMAIRGYFSHDSPDGKPPWHWFEKAGYAYSHAGENLAVYFSDSEEVEKAWMNSPTHRDNIVSGKYTEIGIALAQGTYQGHETTFVVQMFAASASPAKASATEGTPESVEVVASTTSAPEGTVAGAAAEARPIGAVTEKPNAFWRLASAPKTTLQYVYIAIAFVVLIALVLLVAIEFRRHALPHAFAGIGLLALIAALLWSGMDFMTGQLLIL